MVHLQYRSALAASLAVLFAASAAHAEPAVPPPADSLPGSEVLPGLGLSPQAPPVPPAAGGRAPSFGAPFEKSPAAFRFGGRISGFEAVGFGREPANPPPGYSGTSLHLPTSASATGKLPYWAGAGLTLNFSYGTPTLSAYASYYFQLNGKEHQGYYSPQQGPGFGVAYLLINPDPIGPVRLKFKVGDFVEIYGGPGQWGWGIFGPMLALRGFGEIASADWDLARDLHLTLTHGFLVVPGVPETFPRGDYNSWLETGISNWVNHAHVGIDYKNQYHLKLHYASAHGADERMHVQNFLAGNNHADGRMDTYITELGWDGAPWGHIGLSGALYDIHNGTSVSDGVWWADNWTQGAKDITNKYLGSSSNGNGKVAMIGAEYNFSVASILWYPRSFNSQAPDIRVAIAAMMTRTLATEDPLFKNATGYFFGVDIEYRMTAQFSLMFKSFGESRPANMLVPDPNGGTKDSTATATVPTVPLYQRYGCYSLNPGIAYHTNWTSLDRIELYYGRRFYSSAVDYNSAQPLDHHMIALGGNITF
jgi:hypothetical protein